MRRGTTALSGTDWDLSPDYVTEIITRDGSVIGGKYDHTGTFNTSYLVTYSAWSCGGPHQDYSGGGILIRATPPGLPKSSYHSHWTSWTTLPRSSAQTAEGTDLGDSSVGQGPRAGCRSWSG
jgi:hypothetical protein